MGIVRCSQIRPSRPWWSRLSDRATCLSDKKARQNRQAGRGGLPGVRWLCLRT